MVKRLAVKKNGALAAEVCKKSKLLLPRYARTAKKNASRPAWERDSYFLQHL